MDVEKTVKRVREEADRGIQTFFYYAYIPTLMAIGRFWLTSRRVQGLPALQDGRSDGCIVIKRSESIKLIPRPSCSFISRTRSKMAY
jgi:hypothetical protein